MLLLALVGAVPPRSPASRFSASAHIFTGVVVSTSSTLVDQQGQAIDEASAVASEWTDRKVVATVVVDEVEKDTEDVCTTGHQITVTYEQTARRPPGWTGPQGQNGNLLPQSRVRCFADKSLRLLTPNGWEILEDSPQKPRLRHSRRHDFSGVVELTRDVTAAECPWLTQDLPRGQVLRVFTGYTYGSISAKGVAVQDSNHPNGAFVEVPADALRQRA